MEIQKAVQEMDDASEKRNYVVKRPVDAQVRQTPMLMPLRYLRKAQQRLQKQIVLERRQELQRLQPYWQV